MTGEELRRMTVDWLEAWDRFDLDAVTALFSEDAVFETWGGVRIEGRENIRRVWKNWFEAGGFRFTAESVVADGDTGTVVFPWRYEGPAKCFGGRTEKRRGIDLLRFRDGRITEKITYTKTTIEVEGKRISLTHGEDA